MDFDLLVIGASAAGWQGAIAAARLDHKVGLISLLPFQSNPAVDLRDLPSSLLRDVCADWPIITRGSKQPDRIPQTATWRHFADYALRIWQQEQETYRDQLLSAGGKIWVGEPRLSSPHTVRLKRPKTKLLELRSEHLLIATGTTPRSPHFAAGFLPPLKNVASLLDETTLGSEACVIGASLTGLRAACLLALWGTRVRVLDGRTISAVDSIENGINWYTWGKQLGVHFESGEDVIGLQQRNTRKTDVILESGRHISTEAVWLGTGRNGRTAELCLANAGLTTDDCGRLWCDPNYRTWVPSIYAIGDVVGFPPDIGSVPELAGTIVTKLFQPANSRMPMVAT